MASGNPIRVKIDGQDLPVPEGVTILEAARGHGIFIPTLCHHEDLSPYGGCRLCVVEVDAAPRLAAACVTPVRPGMEIVTDNPRIREARRTVLEFLFAERNHYCMFCARSGDCELQDLAYRFQMEHLTVPTMDQVFPVDTSHPDLVIDHNRCVLCGRCVRACRELAGQKVLDFHNRGAKVMIGADLAEPLGPSTCVSCGACQDYCPTGAIYLRHATHYAVKGKRRDWDAVETICTECEMLCPATYHVRDNALVKLSSRIAALDDPRTPPLCRLGRLAPFMQTGYLLRTSRIRSGNTYRDATTDEALDRAAEALDEARRREGGRKILGLISSRAAYEDLARFRDLMTDGLAAGWVDTLDSRPRRTWREASGAVDRGAPPAAILDAGCLVFAGGGWEETHPMFIALGRRAVLENRARVLVIGDRNVLGSLTDVFVEAAPADWPALLGALNQMAANDGVNPPGASPGHPMLGEAARLLSRGDRTVLVAGAQWPGPGDERDTGRCILPLLRLAQSLGGRVVLPRIGANAAAAERLFVPGNGGAPGGDFHAGLICLAGESAVDGDLAPLLRSLSCRILVAPRVPEALADWADVVIPGPGVLESQGIYNSNGSESLVRKRILEPPESVRTIARLIRALSERLVGSPQAAVPEDSGREGK